MKFKKEIEKLERSAVRLTITIEQNDALAQYKTTLEKYLKKAQIPGFRKGHVPASILERKFGNTIKADVANDLIETAFDEVFSPGNENQIEDKYRPIFCCQPVIDSLSEFNPEKDFVFSLVYDILPTFEINDFSGITIKEPQIEITEDDIKNQLKLVQERNAVIIDKKDEESAENDNIVTINIVELDDNDNEISETRRDGFVFTLRTGDDVYQINNEIIGMKKGDTKVVTTKNTNTKKNVSVSKINDPQDFLDKVSEMNEKQNASENADDSSSVEPKTTKYRITVTQIKVRILPELDDDLAQDVNEKYKTLDDLKTDIIKRMNVEKDKNITEIKNNDLLSQLIKKYPFDVPVSFLSYERETKWRNLAQRYQVTTEDFNQMVAASGESKDSVLAQFAGNLEDSLRKQIILHNLVVSRNVSVTSEEIEEEFEKLAIENSLPVEDIRKQYNIPDVKEYFISHIKEQKALESIYPQIKIEKGDKMTYEQILAAEDDD